METVTAQAVRVVNISKGNLTIDSLNERILPGKDMEFSSWGEAIRRAPEFHAYRAKGHIKIEYIAGEDAVVTEVAVAGADPVVVPEAMPVSSPSSTDLQAMVAMEQMLRTLAQGDNNS